MCDKLESYKNHNTKEISASTTQMISKAQTVKNTISAGLWHTFVVKADGSLWAWGYSWYGLFGKHSTKSRRKPIKIMEDSTAISQGLIM